MSARNSGYARRKSNLYETPAWPVTEVLVDFYPVAGLMVKEPACGNGKMALALDACGADVWPSDKALHPRLVGALPMRMQKRFKLADFVLDPAHRRESAWDAICTNPPYGIQGVLACQFIIRSLEFLRANIAAGRFVALLLPVDFDSASTRASLFDLCPEFKGQIVLRKRVEWFPRQRKADGTKGNGPSQNHAWFIWEAVPRAPGVRPWKLYQRVDP